MRCGHRRTRLVEDRGVPAPLAQPLEPNAARYAVVATTGTASPIRPDLHTHAPAFASDCLSPSTEIKGEKEATLREPWATPVSNAPALVASTSLDAILR